MTDGGLAVSRFRQRAAEWRVIEDRVVPEAAVPFRLVGDSTFDDAFGFKERAGRARQGQRANESRRAVQGALRPERVVNELEFPWIGRIRSAVSRRFHSGQAGKPVNLQPRIL